MFLSIFQALLKDETEIQSRASELEPEKKLFREDTKPCCVSKYTELILKDLVVATR